MTPRVTHSMSTIAERVCVAAAGHSAEPTLDVIDTTRPDAPHAQLRQKALHGVFWSAVCLWGNRVFTLLFFAILARLLDPAAFGLVALSGVYIGFLVVFQEQGFGYAIIQRGQLHPDHLNTAFWMNMGLALALTLATLLGASFIGRVFHEPRLAGVVRGLSPLLILGSLTSVQRALQFRNFCFRSLAVASIVGIVVGGAVGVLAALRGAGVWSLVLHQITMRASESGVLWWQSDWRPGLRLRWAQLRDMVGFGNYVVVGELASFTYLSTADIVIGLFLGPTAVGLFSVAFRCVRMVQDMIGGVVANVSLPTFARLQRQPERGRAVFLKATSQIALFSFPVFTAIAVLAPEIVAAVFGGKWMSVVPVMRVLSLVGMARSVFYLKRHLVLAYGRPKWHLGLQLLTVVLTLAGVLLAVSGGILAVAWAQALALLASFPLLFLAVSRLVHVRLIEDLQALLPALTASLVMAVVVFVTKVVIAGRVAPGIVLAAGLLVGAGIYIGAVRAIDPNSFLRSVHYIRAMLGRKEYGEAPAGV
jgi:O-antigen/teichoic acid export membrane protein